jgi:Ser-tRNA(Ala) deacylase AlaX
MNTKKIYYTTSEVNLHTATIVGINEDSIELDETIAFPEGGGQEGDHGEIFLNNNPNIKVNFIDTQLVNAVKLNDPDYPACKIGGTIIHILPSSQVELIKNFSIGDKINIQIDLDRRNKLTQSHSATHIMYMAIDTLKGNIVNNLIGCHIKPDGGRLDFLTDYRFSPEEIKIIEEKSNSIINDNLKIKIISDITYPDIRTWVCNDYQIPCGGTHVNNSGEIPLIKVSRKSIGKGKERVLFNWM